MASKIHNLMQMHIKSYQIRSLSLSLSLSLSRIVHKKMPTTCVMAVQFQMCIDIMLRRCMHEHSPSHNIKINVRRPACNNNYAIIVMTGVIVRSMHIKQECSLVTMTCPNGCGEKISKKDVRLSAVGDIH